MLRRIAVAAILGMAAIGGWAVSTHRVSYVVTHGVSMQPTYHAGDLVFLTKVDSYEIGQIAAYHSPSADLEVLHRIIGGDTESGYVLQGDNNDFIDPIRPTTEDMIGQAVLRIPHGGAWLQPLLSPTGLGMIGFLVVGGRASTAKSRRQIARGRRKKKVKGMSGGGGSLATAAVVFKAAKRLHPALRTLAVISTLCGIIGLTSGVLGWIKPVAEPVNHPGKSGESMTFSYSAEVARSAAYDGDQAYSPDPIFRKLANLVDLNVNYTGTPGQIQISARMAAQNGWHTTLQLSQQQQFSTKNYAGTVQLDLNALEGRARAAGEAIGTDLSAVTLTITAQVKHADGTTFEPQVSLNLAPLQLTLAGGVESLSVNQSSTAAGVSLQERQIRAFGYDVLTAAEARNNAIYLLLTAIAGAGIISMMALRNVPLRTRDQIQRRYPHLLVPVEPMASPPGKPVVIVDTFPALVKLAEKYGQMILTWTRPDGADDFVVRDEGILYRYRIEPNVVPTIPVKVDRTPAAASPSDRVASEPGTVPVLQLPPAPDAPPALQADQPEGEEPTTPEDTATMKAAPRKRTSRTAAAKAAAKTTATKAAPSKRAPAKAPAKRTRAQAKATGTPASEVAMTAKSEVPTQSAFTDIADGLRTGGPDVTTEAAASPGTGVAAEAIAEAMDPASVRDASDSTPHLDDKSAANPAAEPAQKTSPESASDSVQLAQALAELANLPETRIPELEASPAQPEALATEADSAPAGLAQVAAEAEETPADRDQDVAETEKSAALAEEASTEPGWDAAEPESHTVEPETSTADLGSGVPAPGQATTGSESPAAELGQLTSESKSATPESAPTEPTDPEGLEPETNQEATQPEPSTAADNAHDESPTTPKTTQPEVTDSQPPLSPQRTSRRKGRSHRSPRPTMDEPPTADRPTPTDEAALAQPTAVIPEAPANEAREAMEDLAIRNRPITTPEPEPEAKPEPRREPIYDFLPAAKRVPSSPDPEDEPEA